MTDDLWLGIIKVIGGLAGTAISLLLPVLIAFAVKKYKLDVTEKQEAQLAFAAREAVKVVEELAAAHFKVRGEKMAPELQHSMAVTQVLDKLPKTAPGEAERKVTAALVDEGMGASAHPRPAPEPK